MSVRIHHLNCGTMCPYGRKLLAGEGGLFEKAHMVCHCLLIETAKGLVLVDTGYGTPDIRNPAHLGRPFLALTRPQLRQEETALSQIEKLGFKADDVRDVVVTHLDLDHAGGLPDFPKARVHAYAAEIAAAMNPTLRERMRYIADQWAHGPQWVHHAVQGDRWFGFEAIRALPDSDAEVLLVPLTGHTRGHCGVAVKNGDRWLLHCGDAYFFNGEVETPARAPVGILAFQSLLQVDGPKRLHNQRRLRELKAQHGGEVDLFCAHDPGELARYG